MTAQRRRETPETTGSGGAAAEEDVSRLEHRVVFNEAVFLPSHGAWPRAGATKRALNYLCFANSKTLFRSARRDRKWREPKEHAPVVVRLSYHANEPARLDDVHAYYLEETRTRWTDGATGRSSGSGGKREKRTDARVPRRWGALRRDARAGGRAPARAALPPAPHVELGRGDAALVRPGGGSGRRGGRGSGASCRARARRRRREGRGGGRVKFDDDRVFANFVGATHVLQFEDEGEGEDAKPFGMFVSERCHDGDMVVGRMVEENA